MVDLSSTSSSDSSTDEEFEFLGYIKQNLNKVRRPYLLSTRIDHLNKWDDQDFFARFRSRKLQLFHKGKIINITHQ